MSGRCYNIWFSVIRCRRYKFLLHRTQFQWDWRGQYVHFVNNPTRRIYYIRKGQLQSLPVEFPSWLYTWKFLCCDFIFYFIYILFLLILFFSKHCYWETFWEYIYFFYLQILNCDLTPDFIHQGQRSFYRHMTTHSLTSSSFTESGDWFHLVQCILYELGVTCVFVRGRCHTVIRSALLSRGVAVIENISIQALRCLASITQSTIINDVTDANTVSYPRCVPYSISS